jgi:hypothetical protein
MAMTRRPTIVGGIIGGSQQHRRGHYVNFTRLWLILSVLLVLALTNPANKGFFRALVHLPPRQSGTRIHPSTSGTKRTTFFQPRVTNYGLFSVEEKIGAVTMRGLGGSWVCPHGDAELAPLCDVIGKHITRLENVSKCEHPNFVPSSLTLFLVDICSY